MPYYEFGANDIFVNRIKAHPKCDFVIYAGQVFYNNTTVESGSFQGIGQSHLKRVNNVPVGHISLYDLNTNRPETQLIYPFVSKAGSLHSFKTISDSEFNNDFVFGDTLTGSYPLSASISRDYYSSGQTRPSVAALQNTINYYQTLSQQFAFSSSLRDLSTDVVSVISIPSIFYGSSIRKGSIDLKFYVTGTLAAQAKDENQNGELIQVGPTGSVGSGSTVGIALYNEGFLLLTGSSEINPNNIDSYEGSGAKPKWIHFASTGSVFSSSFQMTFEGTNYIPTLSMMAHAPKGQLNHSNNPTYLKYSDFSTKLPTSASGVWIESADIDVKNTVKSPFEDPTGSFEKQVYISRVSVYDKDKNLIGIAKLATPIRKREIDSYTFKLKLDF
jgi:hypothetical protein